MPTYDEHWEPEEWENHAHGLLRDRHGATNVMKVPDRHKGDRGLDYYCLKEAVTYQCYAVEMPCDVATRATRQKAKISTDLKKFCANTPDLKAMFADVRIRRWILLVPLLDSAELNQHAGLKASEVRALKLGYVAEDFEVLVQDQDSFDQWSREQRAIRRRALDITSAAPSTDEIADYAKTSNHLVSNLTSKLAKRVTSGSISDGVSEAIGWLLARDNSLERLRESAPEVHDALMGVIDRHTKRLQIAGLPTEGTPHAILREEIDLLTKALKDSMPSVTDDSAEQIAFGTVADWLLRCPLDFPPYAQA